MLIIHICKQMRCWKMYKNISKCFLAILVATYIHVPPRPLGTAHKHHSGNKNNLRVYIAELYTIEVVQWVRLPMSVNTFFVICYSIIIKKV